MDRIRLLILGTGGMARNHAEGFGQIPGVQIVGGVDARKAGTTVSHVNAAGETVELPVFATVGEAMAATGADVSVAFVPPAFTKDAAIEAIDAGIGLLVIITEGVPVKDSAELWAHAKATGTAKRKSAATAKKAARSAAGKKAAATRAAKK